jgi:DNA-binding Lrp family transcriptional regulator
MQCIKFPISIREEKWFKDSISVHLFFYLLTKSFNTDGTVAISQRRLAEELNTTVDKIRTRLAKFESYGIIEIQHLSNTYPTVIQQQQTFITICNFNSYNPLENSESNTYPTVIQQLSNSQKENFPPTPPLKENNIYNPLILTDEPPLKKTPKEIFDEVVDLWHAICVDLPQVRVRNATRQKKVLCRVSEMGGYEKALPVIEEVFRTAQSISFYKGDNNRGWKASFDWFFENDTNWAKVLERVHQNGQRTYTNSNTEQARIIQERREQHLHDIERIQSDYLSKIGR